MGDMASSTVSARDTLKAYSNPFLQLAEDWYFGGYLKMETERAPDPARLVLFLRALGFIESKVDSPKTRISTRAGEEYRIEIHCNNPRLDVKMEFPALNSNVPGKNAADVALNFPEIPDNKSTIVKEVFDVMMEFLMDHEEVAERKDKSHELQRWRRCMSLSTLGTRSPRICLPDQLSSRNIESEELPNENEVGKVAVETEANYSVKELGSSCNNTSKRCILVTQQDEEMEVDQKLLHSPNSQHSSLTDSSLSPVGLARQRTWVHISSKSEAKKEFDNAKTSTPMKTCQPIRHGGFTTRAAGKILRPRQTRPEIQSQRLKSTNAETMHSMALIKNAKELSTKTSGNSRNSTTSFVCSSSSQKPTIAARGSYITKTSSNLLVPPRMVLTTPGGAIPKQRIRSPVSPLTSTSSGLKRSTGTIGNSERYSGFSLREKELSVPSKVLAEGEERRSFSAKVQSCNSEKLRSDGDKMTLKQRPSFLPRMRSSNRGLVPSKGPTGEQNLKK